MVPAVPSTIFYQLQAARCALAGSPGHFTLSWSWNNRSAIIIRFESKSTPHSRSLRLSLSQLGPRPTRQFDRKNPTFTVCSWLFYSCRPGWTTAVESPPSLHRQLPLKESRTSRGSGKRRGRGRESLIRPLVCFEGRWSRQHRY